MFAGRTTPAGINALVLDEINRLGGLRKAFPHNGRIQLYSGPNKDYLYLAVGAKTKNFARAEKQAKEKGWNANRIDDTPIGDFIFVDNDLYVWLQQVHTDPATGLIDDAKVDMDAKKVTAFASAIFIRAAFGHVKTAVCGADRERVFYETEVPGLCDRNAFPPEAETLVAALLDNKDIEIVNGVPAMLWLVSIANKTTSEFKVNRTP